MHLRQYKLRYAHSRRNHLLHINNVTEKGLVLMIARVKRVVAIQDEPFFSDITKTVWTFSYYVNLYAPW